MRLVELHGHALGRGRAEEDEDLPVDLRHLLAPGVIQGSTGERRARTPAACRERRPRAGRYSAHADADHPRLRPRARRRNRHPARARQPGSRAGRHHDRSRQPDAREDDGERAQGARARRPRRCASGAWRRPSPRAGAQRRRLMCTAKAASTGQCCPSRLRDRSPRTQWHFSRNGSGPASCSARPGRSRTSRGCSRSIPGCGPSGSC